MSTTETGTTSAVPENMKVYVDSDARARVGEAVAAVKGLSLQVMGRCQFHPPLNAVTSVETLLEDMKRSEDHVDLIRTQVLTHDGPIADSTIEALLEAEGLSNMVAERR